jgi:hypothetical protein
MHQVNADLMHLLEALLEALERVQQVCHARKTVVAGRR